MTIAELLAQLQQADSDEERAALTAEMSIGQLEEPVQTVARQCGLLPWFDEGVVTALLQALGHEDGAAETVAVIAALPFVEKVAWGYQFHAMTADGWREKYNQPPYTFVIEANQAVVAGYMAQWDEQLHAALSAVEALILSQQYTLAYEKVETLIYRLVGEKDSSSLLALLNMLERTAALKWVTLPPYPQFFWFALGYANQDLKRYEDALTAYDRALELDPEDAVAYNNRGIAKRNLKRYEEAIKDYDRALELDPENASAYNNRGIAKRNLKRYEEAIKDYDRALELDPEDAHTYNHRGIIHSLSERYDLAILDFQKSMELATEYAFPYPYGSYARLEVRRGNFDEMLKWLEEALKRGATAVIDWVNEEEDFDLVRGDARFVALLEKYARD